MNNPFRIDIEKVIAEKNPKLAKRLPKFLINYIKRIVHQEEINDFLDKHKDVKNIEFIDAVLNVFRNKLNYFGLENINQTKKYIFVANHPLGGLESLGFIKMIDSVFPGKVKFFVNDVLLNIQNLSDIFVPINKYGKQNKTSAIHSDFVYKSDNQILYYPAGLVSRRFKGKIMDLPWKKSVFKKAAQYKREVIPVFIDAKNSERFYRIFHIRKLLGIKANIELFFLVDEMFRFHDKKIDFYVGKPIPYSIFSDNKKLDFITKKLQNFVHFNLKKDIYANFTL